MKKRRSTNSCLGVLFFAPLLKGAVPRYTVIFCAFLREQKWQLLALVSRTSDLKAWPAVRPGSFATNAGYWQCSEPTTSRARVALLHLSTATVSTFYSLYEARPRWKPLLQTQSSRLAATDISYHEYWFLIHVFRSPRLPKLVSAISSPRAWVTGTRNRQCGRSSLCSDFDDVYHCEGKCAEQGTSWRKGCRRSCRPADRLCCGICTVRDKDLYGDSRNALVVSCGDVKMGDRGRSKETLRALTCRFSSSLPEGALLNTAHPAVHLETRRW